MGKPFHSVWCRGVYSRCCPEPSLFSVLWKPAYSVLWLVGSHKAAYIKVFLLWLKQCQTQHLSNPAAVCLLCVCQSFHVKTKKLKKKLKKKVELCQEAIKLSTLPCVMTPLRLYSNLRDLTSTVFTKKKKDLEMFPQTFSTHCFLVFLPLSFSKTEQKCKMSNSLWCCGALQDSVLLWLNDAWA